MWLANQLVNPTKVKLAFNKNVICCSISNAVKKGKREKDMTFKETEVNTN